MEEDRSTAGLTGEKNQNNDKRTAWADLAEEGDENSEPEIEGDGIPIETGENVKDPEVQTQQVEETPGNLTATANRETVETMDTIGGNEAAQEQRSNEGDQRENEEGEWEEQLSKSQKKRRKKQQKKADAEISQSDRTLRSMGTTNGNQC